MDKISKEKRSKNMSKIKSHDTSIEIKVRKYLLKELHSRLPVIPDNSRF